MKVRRAILALWVALAASAVRADLPEPPPPDAEEMFARGAEALDRGDAAEAGKLFSALVEKYPFPAWTARIDLLRARRALDAGAAADAVESLSTVDARPIGLEGYRRYLLALALERSGRSAAARAAYLAAADEESAPADRSDAAVAAARLSKTREEKRAALAALGRAAPWASTDQIRDSAAARGRLAAELGDDDALAAAAHDILERAPRLLFDRAMPPALNRQVRRLERDLPDGEKIALAERLFDSGETSASLAVTGEVAGDALPVPDRRRWRLARARALQRLGKIDAADREAQRVGPGAPEEGAAALVLAEDLLHRATLHRGRARKNLAIRELPADKARRLAQAFHLATGDAASAPTRMRGFRSEIALWVAAGDVPSALDAARRMTAIDPGATWGFEALWSGVWEKIRGKDDSGALDGILALASIYHEVSAARRLQYWSARCYERLGQKDAALELGHDLSCGDPADLYARFAAAWKSSCPAPAPAEPAERSGTFSRVDELLRVRLYPEAHREAERIAESPGRDLRLALASFALGNFAAATAQAKSAFPQIGTAREGEVPDQWRRLYYPIASGGIVESAAKEFGLNPSVLRAVVRQESAFNARARSKAGASGLTQLMPGTARLLSRSVLKKRFRRAFLYDPAMNVRLGASYLKSLLDRFGNDLLMALAAYNAGPGRIGGFLRDNPGLSADERLESLPATETRDYVRRVFLFSESYRELYPER